MLRLVARHPFLAAALVSLLLMAGWTLAGMAHDGGGIERVIYLVWSAPLRPFAWVATLVDRVTGRWPDALDAAATLAVGLLPYLGADWLWRRARARRGWS